MRLRMLRSSTRALILSLLVIVGLSACAPQSYPLSSTPWRITDLRALDPADAPRPEHDLIALYTRHTRHDLEIRLDLLDLVSETQTEIHLVLDTLPGCALDAPGLFSSKRSWDFVITIPAEGRPQITALQPATANQQPLPTPRIVRDAALDTITLRLNANLLPMSGGPFYLQALAINSQTGAMLDSLNPVSSQRTLTQARAPLLLAFWNTLPAQTPAQALRRWDGAHTGPRGERHGLYNLIQAAGDYRIPITLLDISSPFSLSALDALGGMPTLMTFQRQGLLNAPETLPSAVWGDYPAWVASQALNGTNETKQAFGWPISQIFYGPVLSQQPAARLTMTTGAISPDNGTIPQTHIYRQGQRVFLPLSDDIPTPQVGEEGLNLVIRTTLLENALTDEPAITLLGGDLPHTPWGNPRLAGQAMHYIAAHPWIQPLREKDLLSSPAVASASMPTPAPPTPAQMAALNTLENTPQNAAGALAWQTYFALLSPADPSPPELARLRAASIGVVGDLAAAAQWEAGKLPIRSGEFYNNCNLDTDFDNRAECVLANEKLFAILDPQGGRLKLLFARSQGRTIQLVAPSTQFAVGVSDPFSWDLSRGELADPAGITGAFVGPWQEYRITPLPNGLRFTAGNLVKEFLVLENGLWVNYQFDGFTQVTIPLGIAAESRFAPGWSSRYQSASTPQGWAWGITPGPRAQIRTSGMLSTQSFADDLPALLVPENPNYDYPSGHYLPFPMAVATIQSQGDFWVEITLLP